MNKVGILLLALLSVLFAHQPITAQSANNEIEEINNLSYLDPGDVIVDSLQQLNLVLPKNVKQAPLLLWVGGGAWSFVNRHQEMELVRKIAAQGIAVASVGHRLSSGAFSPQKHPTGVKHPTHIQDVAAAFKWLYNQADQYGYSKRNIFVGGFSSGAHLAALLASDKRYMEAEGLSLDHIRGILPVAGAYDLVDYYQAFVTSEDPNIRPMAETHVKDVFGDTEKGFIEASPSTYLKDLATPMLLISEGALYNYTRVFEDQLLETDYRKYQVLHMFNFDHGGLWRDLSFAETSMPRTVMVDFIKRNAEQ